MTQTQLSLKARAIITERDRPVRCASSYTAIPSISGFPKGLDGVCKVVNTHLPNFQYHHLSFSFIHLTFNISLRNTITWTAYVGYWDLLGRTGYHCKAYWNALTCQIYANDLMYVGCLPFTPTAFIREAMIALLRVSLWLALMGCHLMSPWSPSGQVDTVYKRDCLPRIILSQGWTWVFYLFVLTIS